MHTVSITLNIVDATSDEILVTLNSSCSQYYDTGLESNILLTATEVSNCSTCQNVSIPIAIICSLLEPSNLTIKGVSPSTQYKITAEWISPNIKKHCPLRDSQYIKTSEYLLHFIHAPAYIQNLIIAEAAPLQLELILPLSIGGGLVLLLILLLCLILAYRKHKNKKELKFNFVNLPKNNRATNSFNYKCINN